MRKPLYPLLVLLSWLLFCGCLTENGEVNPSLVKIYTPKGADDFNILTLTAEATEDGGLLLFGLCDPELIQSPFSQATLYLSKIDKQGLLEWDTCFTAMEQGYFSNFIRTENGSYLCFRTSPRGVSYAVELAVDENGATILSQSPVSLPAQLCADCNFIIQAAPHPQSNGYLLLGTGTDNIEGKTLFIATVDAGYQAEALLSQNTFYPDSLGIASSDDFVILQDLYEFLHLTSYNDQYFFTGPVNKQMALSYVGEQEAIYQDGRYWTAALAKNEDQVPALVLSNPSAPSLPVYFVPRLDPSNRYGFSGVADRRPVTGLDVTARIQVERTADRWIIAGTAPSGEATLYLFDPVGQYLRTLSLGFANRYELAVLYESPDGEEIIIAGTTEVNFSIRRPFVIRLPKNTL